jgi:hypothetical protein
MDVLSPYHHLIRNRDRDLLAGDLRDVDARGSRRTTHYLDVLNEAIDWDWFAD